MGEPAILPFIVKALGESYPAYKHLDQMMAEVAHIMNDASASFRGRFLEALEVAKALGLVKVEGNVIAMTLVLWHKLQKRNAEAVAAHKNLAQAEGEETRKSGKDEGKSDDGLGKNGPSFANKGTKDEEPTKMQPY